MTIKQLNFSLLLLFLSISQYTYTQSPHQTCKTPAVENPFFSTEVSAEKTNNFYYIPIALHLFTDSAGGGNELSPAMFEQSLDSINVYLNTVDLEVVLCSLNVVMDNNNVNPVPDLDGALMDSLWTPGMINVYIPNTSNGFDSEGSSTTIGGPFTNQDFLFMLGKGYTYGLLAHEIGHFLGLYHTFDNRFGYGRVDGTNCQSTGDLICDTPADPGLNRPDIDSTTCEWLAPGTLFDSNNDAYAPNTRNIMCYSPLHCLTEISPLQLQVMRNTFLSNITFFDTLCGLATSTLAPEPIVPSTLYPNPASQLVKLIPGSIAQANHSVMTIEVFDGMGAQKAQMKGRSSQKAFPIDLNGLSPGIYWIRVSNGSQQEILKLSLLK